MAVDMRKLLEGLGCVKSQWGAMECDGISVCPSPEEGHTVARVAICGGAIYPTKRRTVQVNVQADTLLSTEAARKMAQALSLAADIADAYNRERGE